MLTLEVTLTGSERKVINVLMLRSQFNFSEPLTEAELSKRGGELDQCMYCTVLYDPKGVVDGITTKTHFESCRSPELDLVSRP